MFIISANLFAQDLQYRDLESYQRTASFTEVELRLELMLKEKSLIDFFEVHPDRLEVYSDDSKTNLEFTYYFGSGNSQRTSFNSLKGLKVLIDPGHIGGDFAYEEDRYIEMLYDPSITFKEGDLTLYSAHYLQDLLEAQGAIVQLTRDLVGHSGEKVTYDQFKQDKALIAAAIDVVSEDALDKQWWLNNHNQTKYLDVLFTKFDYRMRARRARSFKPDLSISIHYNACFPRKVQTVDRGQIVYRDQTSNRNYHMAFVPGSYLDGELKHKRKRIELVRWLISGELEESISLAHYFMEEVANQTKVSVVEDLAELDYLNDHRTDDQVSNNYEQNYLRRSSQPIGTQNGKDLYGVFSRNLYINHYAGASIMGETFCQEAEHLNLYKKDFTVRGNQTSSRVKDAAEAYFQAIKKWAKDPLIKFEKL